MTDFTKEQRRHLNFYENTSHEINTLERQIRLKNFEEAEKTLENILKQVRDKKQ